jgi:hypothetical protein
MAARPHRRARIAAALAALLCVPALAGISPGEKPPRGGHQDAAPSGRPPGFEPVDVEEEVAEVRARETRALEQQVDIESDYRQMTAEPWLRARYGSATWSLYEPYH